MRDLSDELDDLSDLDELRSRARTLRDEGMAALQRVQDNWPTRWNGYSKLPDAEGRDRNGYAPPKDLMDVPSTSPEWQGSGGKIEAAMLARVHCKIRSVPAQEDRPDHGRKLMAQLRSISLTKDLLQIPTTPEHAAEAGETDVGEVPVLLAARAMQALVPSAEHTFSRATMLCYYRLLREICVADSPDWNAGGARAGTGGEVTAYVTAECIRAVLMLERSVSETARFFRETDQFYRYANFLAEVKDAPETWKSIEAERAILAWYNSMALRRQYLALDLPLFDPDKQYGDDAPIGGGEHDGNDARETKSTEPNRFTLTALMKYFPVLGQSIHEGLQSSVIAFNDAANDIAAARKQEEDVALNIARARDASATVRLPYKDSKTLQSGEARIQEDQPRFVRYESRFARSMSAHHVAAGVIEKAVKDARLMVAHCEAAGGTLHNLLPLASIFDTVAREVRLLLDPAKRYIASVMDHELTAASQHKPVWDARELAFAAGAYGALTGWRRDERLERAAELLKDDISEYGLFRLGKPFHSVASGLRWQPLHFEVCRALSELLANVHVPVTPKLIGQMLFPFTDMSIEMKEGGEPEPYLLLAFRNRKPPKLRGWHMEDPPIPARPSLWVSGHAVLALDKLVRMLDQKINDIVLEHFTSKPPEKIGQGLDDLFYPDYGRKLFYPPNHVPDAPDTAPDEPVAIILERMRAHIVGVKLPRAYRKAVYSIVLHGPPGTGKTTMLEALAKSSNVPLIEMSPSDIAVNGEQAIEARARATFQALSMLTQVVINFDEFEPVLQRRKTKEDIPESRSMYPFLTPGMLPKLTRLYNEARHKRTAYALVTNLLRKLDDAAIRPGRFDRHVGIYMPDPVSRAGWFMRVLAAELERRANEDPPTQGDTYGSMADDLVPERSTTRPPVAFSLSPDQKTKFNEVIRGSGGVPPSRLTPRWLNVLNGEDGAMGGGDYVLYDKEWRPLKSAILPHPRSNLSQYKMLYLPEEQRLNAWEWAVKRGSGLLHTLLVEPEADISRWHTDLREMAEKILKDRREARRRGSGTR